MKRSPLYSSSARSRREGSGPGDRSPPEHPAGPPSPRRWRVPAVGPRSTLLLGGGVVALLAFMLHGTLRPTEPALTQHDIDRAVLYTLENLPPSPSVESMAFRTIMPSVVRVRRLGADPEDSRIEGGGTGVLIVDDGTILTNLHVVAGSERLTVTFYDGTESPATLVSVQPEQDLAVIQATLLPDDIVPATLRSTSDLRMGDRVIAVGYPFGIGPSLSAGVISGMRREYRSPQGERLLTNLIQFDAAANPGNSGGPLVTEDGHVVGIVTAILNPSARFFIGIGFAVPIETATQSIGESPF